MREGKRLRTPHLDVRVVASPRDHSRVGFVVAKQGHTAVARNRVKRTLKELTRLELLPALRGLPVGGAADVVLRARPDTYRASLDTLRPEIAGLAARVLQLAAARSPMTGGRDTPAPGKP